MQIYHNVSNVFGDEKITYSALILHQHLISSMILSGFLCLLTITSLLMTSSYNDRQHGCLREVRRVS